MSSASTTSQHALPSYMLHSDKRPRAYQPLVALAIVGLASPLAYSAAPPAESLPGSLPGSLPVWTPQQADAAVAAPSVDIGPPPRIADTSAMDPALVALLNERIAAVEADPSSLDARVSLGFAYESNTIWSLAEVCYTQAVELAPTELQWRFRRGIVRYAIGDVDGAIEDLQAAADTFKNTPVVQARLGDVLRLVGELEAAEAAWRQAIAAEENQPKPEGRTEPLRWAPSRVGLAQTLLDLEEAAEAEALCRQALQMQPGYKQAHYTLGLALRDQGRDLEAKPELTIGEASFQIFPPDPHAQQLMESTRGFSRRMMMIENLVQEGNLPEAKRRLDSIRQERPDDHMVLNLAARVSLRGGDLAGAREMLQKSLEVTPGQPGTLIEACLLELRESEAIVAQLGQMQMAQQQTQTIDQARFNALRTQGGERAAKAVDYATRAAQAAPAVGRHHYWLGVAQRSSATFATDAQSQQQQFQTALQSMQNAARLGCTEPGFNQQLAGLYAQMGRAREMMLHTERHLAENPKDPAAIQLMIENSIRSGMPERTTAEVLNPLVEKLVAAAPGDPGVAQFAVRVYLTVKDYDKAEAALSTFEAAAAGNPQAAAFITAVQSAIVAERAKEAADPPAPAPADKSSQNDGQDA